MTKAQHTPGPWTRAPNCSGMILGPDGLAVAITTSRPQPGRNLQLSEIEAANAALIAAAPDMLEALTALLAHAEALNNVAPKSEGPRSTSPRFGFNPYSVPQFNAARAAIEKATAT